MSSGRPVANITTNHQYPGLAAASTVMTSPTAQAASSIVRRPTRSARAASGSAPRATRDGCRRARDRARFPTDLPGRRPSSRYRGGRTSGPRLRAQTPPRTARLPRRTRSTPRRGSGRRSIGAVAAATPVPAPPLSSTRPCERFDGCTLARQSIRHSGIVAPARCTRTCRRAATRRPRPRDRRSRRTEMPREARL